MNSKPEILVVDDEPQIRKLLKINLENNGYSVRLAATGGEGLIMAASHPPDLILLDIGLPDKTGHEVLKELRLWYDRAILMLSVRNGEEDIVEALDLGATDYLAKPFRTAELLARIRAGMRRNPGRETGDLLESGDLSIDFKARTVRKNGEPVKLTATEFRLLALLAGNGGGVMTHQHLLKEVWGQSYQDQSQYLRVYIGALRKKIETNPNEPVHLITESGVGYRFV